MAGENAVIIKRIKKGGHAGHHGGAWKVAYADFVTAMMAFFLLMWLINTTTPEQKRGIADYFAPQSIAQPVSGRGGVLGGTAAGGDKITIEVHDSGPGLSPQARGSLFQPAISFKRGGMGLGLSIARKSALLAGGDILLVPGELGGAAFRVLLPVA